MASPVTDPALLKLLEAGGDAAPVSDPALLAQLEGAAPAEAGRLTPGWLRAATVGAQKGLTANFIDEIAAGMMTPIEMGVGAWNGHDAGKGVRERISSAYERAVTRERASQRALEEQHPVASTVGNIAGGLALGGGANKAGLTLLNAAKPTAASMIGRGAAEAGIYGGLYGAGEGEGAADSINKAVMGAGVGAGVGGAVGKIASVSASRVARQAVPAVDELRAAKSAAFKAADDAGIVYTPQVFQRVGANLKNELAELGYDATLQPRIGAILNRFDEAGGQNVTLKGAENLRRVARAAYDPVNDTSNMMMGRAVAAIDNALENPAAGDILMGNAAQGIPAIKQAREYSSRLFKALDVEDAVKSAQLRAASTGSGGNSDNATRQALRRVLEDRKNWTGTEREALLTAITGTRGQNALRLVGKLSPSGNGLMAALGLGATAVNPAMAIPAVGGIAAKAAADRMTQSNVQRLVDIILNGGSQPSLTALPAGRKALMGALIKTAGQQGSMISGKSP